MNQTHSLKDQGALKAFFSRVRNRIAFLYKKMRPTEKVFFVLFSTVFIIGGWFFLQNVNDRFSTELPVHGGTYTEGVVGYARFVNPVLGYTDADRDMINLIYSGLLKATPEGKLVGDLAESWEVSDDGLTYTVTLRDGIFFHDNTPITTEDIEFTLTKIIDPEIKSPRAENWSSVKIEKVNEREMRFTLQEPYAPFLENLTVGILPKHIWANIENAAFDINVFNREPIGSGPFKIKKAYKNETGIYEYYELEPFEEYALGQPYINHLVMRFYKNEQEALKAYRNGSIDALGGISPDEALKLKTDEYNVLSTPLPRVFGLFFNQSEAPVLVNKEVRKALDAAIDRNTLIDAVLKGWGAPATSAIPHGLSSETELTERADSPLTAFSTSTETVDEANLDTARKILTDAGWKLGENGIFQKQTKKGKSTETQVLQFSISTSNVPELKQTAEILRDTWTKLGADVKVEIFEPSDLTQKVIRPRKYDSLLFGNVVGRDLDLYPFWHSSQRNDPGLNIALYTNIKADKALETIRDTSDETKKNDAYKAFEKEIQNDIPAIFLYSPDYIYATNKSVKDIQILNITSPSERFMNITNWYIETEKVWNIFVK